MAKTALRSGLLDIGLHLLLALCVSSIRGQGNVQCYHGWYYHQGSCYGFGEDSVTWAEAEEMCEIFGAKLAEIKTAEENTFLKNVVKTKAAPCAWIGGSDVFNEGHWEWVSSREPINGFQDWAPGEPNHDSNIGGEDCLQLFKYMDYQWNDADCKSTSYFICEAEPLGEFIVG